MRDIFLVILLLMCDTRHLHLLLDIHIDRLIKCATLFNLIFASEFRFELNRSQSSESGRPPNLISSSGFSDRKSTKIKNIQVVYGRRPNEEGCGIRNMKVRVEFCVLVHTESNPHIPIGLIVPIESNPESQSGR